MFEPVYPVRLTDGSSARFGLRPDRAIELPAPESLQTAIEGQIGACRRYRSSLAVIRLGIDNLADIRERCGDFVGLEVTRLAWARLWTGVREQDVAVNIGDGEFAILIRDALPPIAALVVKRVAEQLSDPFRVNDLVVCLRVGSGYSLHMPEGDADAIALGDAATQVRFAGRAGR